MLDRADIDDAADGLDEDETLVRGEFGLHVVLAHLGSHLDEGAMAEGQADGVAWHRGECQDDAVSDFPLHAPVDRRVEASPGGEQVVAELGPLLAEAGVQKRLDHGFVAEAGDGGVDALGVDLPVDHCSKHGLGSPADLAATKNIGDHARFEVPPVVAEPVEPHLADLVAGLVAVATENESFHSALNSQYSMRFSTPITWRLKRRYYT